MKKKLFSALLATVVLLILSVPALAAEESRTFYVDVCYRNGEEQRRDDEYVVLNPDGTGMVVYCRCAYSLNWTQNGEALTFTDHKGKEFAGTLRDGVLQGEFHGCEYVYKPGGPAPVTTLSPGTWGKGLPLVTDQADLLTDSEEADLTQRAREVSERYGCGVYIVTLGDMRDFSPSGSVETCAEEIRTGYSLGYGPEKNCVVLLLSMAERDYDLMAYGSFGNASFTDYGKNYMEDRFLDDFREDRWADGFSDYVKQCDYLLKLSAEGRPLDVNNKPVNRALSAVLSLLPGFLIAWVVCSVLKSRMKPTKEQTAAGGYIPANGVNITYRYDQYTHSTEKRIYDPPQRSSGGRSGGGGGTHVSSSGHSHSSGKF